MGKGRDKQGRETKKKKKVKGAGAPAPTANQFRHHSVVTNQPDVARGMMSYGTARRINDLFRERLAVDALVSKWMAGSGSAIPLSDAGPLDGLPSHTWRTRVIENKSDLNASIVLERAIQQQH